MSQVLASALPDKPVLSADGRKLGTVHNLTVDVDTGELTAVLVDPDHPEQLPEELSTTDAGNLRVPADTIRGLSDQLVVEFDAHL